VFPKEEHVNTAFISFEQKNNSHGRQVHLKASQASKLRTVGGGYCVQKTNLRNKSINMKERPPLFNRNLTAQFSIISFSKTNRSNFHKSCGGRLQRPDLPAHVAGACVCLRQGQTVAGRCRGQDFRASGRSSTLWRFCTSAVHFGGKEMCPFCSDPFGFGSTCQNKHPLTTCHHSMTSQAQLESWLTCSSSTSECFIFLFVIILKKKIPIPTVLLHSIRLGYNRSGEGRPGSDRHERDERFQLLGSWSSEASPSSGHAGNRNLRSSYGFGLVGNLRCTGANKNANAACAM
jgi:hypothetical protein